MYIYTHIILLCDWEMLEKYISWARIDISTSTCIELYRMFHTQWFW